MELSPFDVEPGPMFNNVSVCLCLILFVMLRKILFCSVSMLCNIATDLATIALFAIFLSDSGKWTRHDALSFMVRSEIRRS